MNSLPVIKESLHIIINSNLFTIFIGFILFDIFTGVTLAFKNNIINSKINKNGITRHFIIIIFVVFFSCLFISLDMKELGKIIIYFYIGSYGLSIFENLTMLGVPFPKWLQEKFLILKETSDRGENDVIKGIEK